MPPIVAAIVVVLVILIFYYYAEPSAAFMPHCTFKALTGYDCPGCGFQRALHAALHGEFAMAWHYNAFVFFAVPAAICFIVSEALRTKHPKLHRILFHPAVLTAILVAVVAWWIGRNIF